MQNNFSSHITKFIILLTFIVSFVAIYISYQTNSILAYNDATAHLNTARRIIDSLTPGVVQVGSVWLPLLHILEVPFVANDFLWHTGLAGSMVSSISFTIAAVFLFKLIFYITRNYIASLIGVIAFISNLNLLYLQTTAMFEPLLIANAMIAIYFLTKWAKTYLIKDLVTGAFFVMLATLTRYDGWALFLTGAFFVFLVTLLYKRKGRDGPLLIFLFLAGFGIFLWLLYNLLIFSDPLFFARGEFSAAAQQKILFDRGQLPTKNNLLLAMTTYSLDVIFNNGLIVVILFLIGLLLYCKNNLLQFKSWGPFLLLTPYFFNIVSLYLGQSVIWLPQIPPYFHTYFNARYGILLLPAITFFIGYLAARNKIMTYVIILGLIGQFALFLIGQKIPLYGTNVGIITLQDTVSSVNKQTLSASNYLHTHYTKGLILVSSASSDAFIFRAALPLHNFITEGNGYFWKNALRDPANLATWIVYFRDTSDRVGKVVSTNPEIKAYYKLVYQNQTYLLYRKDL